MVSLGRRVRPTLMIATVIPARTMEPVWTESTLFRVTVQMGSLEPDVNQILMNVPVILVSTKEPVKMIQTVLPVPVLQDTKGTFVKQVTIKINFPSR